MNGSRKTEHRDDNARALSDSWQELPDAVKYGDLCYQAERYRDALDAYLKVLATPKAGMPTAIAARLHYRIAICYQRRANYRQALDHLDKARQVLPRHIDKVQLARIYGSRGQIVSEMGQYKRAERYLTWAKKLLSRTTEHEELATVENRLGVLYYRSGRHQEAAQAYFNALATYRRVGDTRGEVRSLNNLGLQHKNLCQWRESIHYLDQARTLAEKIGYHELLIATNLNLGIAHLKMGKWELAEENLDTAERFANEFGGTLNGVLINSTRGCLRLRRRQWDDAEEILSTVIRTAEREGFTREGIIAEEFLGEVYLERGDLDRAAEILEGTLTRARDVAPESDMVDEILRRLADVRLRQGRHAEALPLAQEAMNLVEHNGDRYEHPVALKVLALAHLELGNRERGEALMDEALAEFAEVSDPYNRGWANLHYGQYLSRTARASHDPDDFEKALLQLQRAYGAFLDLDARSAAAVAATERAELESAFQRLEEAASYRNKALRILPRGTDPELEARLQQLGVDLEASITERWSAGGDVLTSLREMKRLFQGASGTDGVLEELTRLVVTRSRSSRGCVAHVSEDGIRIAAVYGWAEREAEGLLTGLQTQLMRSSGENRPLWSNNPNEDPQFRSLSTAFGIRSFVLLPLTLTEQRTGFLYVDKTGESLEGGYQEGELNLLTVMANLAALTIVERWNRELAVENKKLKAQIGDADGETRFVTANSDLKETLRLVSKVANSPVSILIEGETGTGKGLLSQVIHDASNRRDRPFVQINCAALPEQLLESELFGHVKGAFTGATYNKTGLFKEAEEGTLFLDEVDKTSLAVQAKLLHVMDAKEVRAVGSVKSFRVDTRVIVATNTNLMERIKAGEFLEDLYYRLNDFILHVPPLRERREDIPLLIEHFLRKFSRQYERPEVHLTPEARRVLLEQQWRGNVRELEKTIRRLVVLADDDVAAGIDLLPADLLSPGAQRKVSASTTLRDEVAKTERRVISDALRANGWNKAQVARELKISYPCLLKKIKDFGLEKPTVA